MTTLRVRLFAVPLCAVLWACEDDGLDRLDAGAGDAAVAEDASISDASPRDADVRHDVGALDAEPVDAGDAGVVDLPDAGPACDGGVDVASIVTSDSSYPFTGTGPASTSGVLELTSSDGQTLSFPFVTDGAGGWSVVAPLFCGTQTAVVRFPELTCGPVTELVVERQACEAADVQITLTWDELGRDFELHLIRPGGQINDDATDCTWTSCISSSPDWGVVGDASDDPRKDVDATGTLGPENIYLVRPEAGLYTVMVEHWGSGDPGADGEVAIILAGAAPVVIPITDLPSRFVRYVATIDWTTRTVTPLPTVHDCTVNWSSGCRDAIP